jgi:hypothetical protein
MAGLPILLLALAAPPVDCLLLSASRAAGAWTLGPTFHFPGPCASPAAAGALAVEGRDRGGRLLFRAPFEAAAVADGEAGAAGGSGVVRLAPARRKRLASLRLLEGDRVLARRQATPAPGPARARAQRRGPEHVHIRWNGRGYPFALVRDARSREVIGSGRDGDLTVATPRPSLELLLSDGVRSRRVLLEAP